MVTTTNQTRAFQSAERKGNKARICKQVSPDDDCEGSPCVEDMTISSSDDWNRFAGHVGNDKSTERRQSKALFTANSKSMMSN